MVEGPSFGGSPGLFHVNLVFRGAGQFDSPG